MTCDKGVDETCPPWGKAKGSGGTMVLQEAFNEGQNWSTRRVINRVRNLYRSNSLPPFRLEEHLVNEILARVIVDDPENEAVDQRHLS
ncbi:hypothetical protein A2U01_0049172 [Trifolium medium]|uniref:Uncharacterized protein n=1 Tax=Trifolium medium TaxID=97028 RepID=A0A392QVR0_9FABA|nr:hypothetical protein [Trifolium medium]